MVNINLETLNDKQKTCLTQLSYLNINEDGCKKILVDGLLVSDLISYIDDFDSFFVGDAGLNEKLVEKLSDKVLGENNFVSKLDIFSGLMQSGLGDLKIINVSEKKNLKSSGFQALTFKDSCGNIGISYRGSDFEFSQGGARDWLEADMLEYFTGKSTQKEEALSYFELNRNSNGNNFLYGHSLGGNLASHTYVEYYNEIKQVFTINGNPINQKLLNNSERIAAFNNPNKFQCNIICGDVVGLLKSNEIYKNNVNYVCNNNTMNKSFISAHLVQSATYDEFGNFITANEVEMVEQMKSRTNTLMKFIQNVRENLNKVEQKFEGIPSKNLFSSYRTSVNNHFKTIIGKFKDKQND